jgi:pantetheine-phosphate adenylyltransferase
MSRPHPTPRIAVYPGSFDPLTLGHEDIAKRATNLFDEVIVAVAVAHHKKTRLPFAKRLALVQTVLGAQAGIRVLPLEGLLVDFCHAHHACAIVRGLRHSTDWNYEAPLAQTNRALSQLSSHAVDSCFLAASPAWGHVSSSIVWEVASLGGDVSTWVSPAVQSALQNALGLKPGAPAGMR